MARIFIDGFESGDHDLWEAESNATVISSAGLDMDGDYCLDLNNSYEYVQKDIIADDEMYFALLYRPTAYNSLQIFTALNSTTQLINITRKETTGEVEARVGTTTLVATGGVLTVNTTYLIEIHIKIADSGGRIEVKIDGLLTIDYTGDTKPDANTQFDKVRIGYSGTGTRKSNAFFDNFLMDDTGWIGDTKIQALVPTGAGNTTGWTPSAGANYECVDEIPASDADYVSINAVDITDTYVTENLAGSIDNIKCVQIQSRSRTEGAPTPTNLKLVSRVNGTDYLSGDKEVPVSEKGLYNIWEDNPDDAAAWEEADVNGMEIGIKSAA